MSLASSHFSGHNTFSLYTDLPVERREYYKANLNIGATKHCRFFHNGQCVNVISGEKHSKGCNVMYHTVYWDVNVKVAKELAKELGLKVYFSDQRYQIGDVWSLHLQWNQLLYCFC